MSRADIPHSHYWEVIVFHMRPGHDEQFEEMTKLYRDANLRAPNILGRVTKE